ncbi:MAG: TlpA family protein disulfide reductase [Clostridium sp.]
MNKKKIIIKAAIVATILVITGTIFNHINHNRENTKEIQSNDMVPESIDDIPPNIIDKVAPDLEQNFKSSAKDFEVHDINGNEVRLSEYKEESIVLHFWNSKSESAKEDLACFEEAIKKYEGQVTFFMVNAVGYNDETPETAIQFLKDNNIEINTVFDSHYDARINYKVTSVPRTVFIDKNGLIQKNIKYSLNKDTLEEQIINLINN